MLRHCRNLLPHVSINPQVDSHHDEKNHQVRNGPENQVALAKDGGQLGAVTEVTDAVPAQAGHRSHEEGDAPNQRDQQGHPSLGQVAVNLPFHHRNVALQSDHEQVSQRGGKADIQKSLADEVLRDGKRFGHFARVEHEVHICYACEEVRGGEVGQEIVERIVKPLVGDDSSDDHGVGGQDEAAEERTHNLGQDELGPVPFVFLTTVVVEEGHALVVMTAYILLGHFTGKLCEATTLQVRTLNHHFTTFSGMNNYSVICKNNIC